jgi:hypothetical protein
MIPYAMPRGSALTVGETLDEVFGKASTDTDPTRLGIKVMVNQLRNAFAHNPWQPKWVIFQKYRNSYPIELDDGSQFTFNATILDGDGVRRFLKKNIPDYAAATGRIRMSHLGNSGLRSKRASTKRIAALLSDTSFW